MVIMIMIIVIIDIANFTKQWQGARYSSWYLRRINYLSLTTNV